MRLFLVRHGQTAYNALGKLQGHGPIPLDETGRAQAAALAQSLANEHVDKAYVSTLLRTRQTAEILLEGRTLPTIYTDLLVERDVGIFAERLKTEFNEAAKLAGFAPEDFQPPQGESFVDVKKRAQTFLQEISNETGNILVVTHGHFICVLLEHLHLRQRGDPHPKNASITIINWDGTKASLASESKNS